MLRYILLQNRPGKTRLVKWYMHIDDAEKERIKTEIHRIVTTRDPRHTNFIEYRDYKLIHRRYRGLFFTFCVDINDNDLVYLEAIHLLVEVLDAHFGNVCELDLVFNFHKVYSIIDEMFLGGEVQETSKPVILTRVSQLEQLSG